MEVVRVSKRGPRNNGGESYFLLDSLHETDGHVTGRGSEISHKSTQRTPVPLSNHVWNGVSYVDGVALGPTTVDTQALLGSFGLVPVSPQ